MSVDQVACVAKTNECIIPEECVVIDVSAEYDADDYGGYDSQ